ncbi:MBL fold metallo-hydrolase [Shewanella sp. 10N.7]|uniref:MBL fold metallo-hydrolase n=1 Tax=Shewanella sp. 10N.7 TaxID=2885093 RepID=UPI001E3E4D93|nr:MBL fold metallo-hydrolase [Shewanella sp. 10N.7]MCC4833602.1 MBL fold metallo-hydrolase [Shewanella sp. 10N.7]
MKYLLVLIGVVVMGLSIKSFLGADKTETPKYQNSDIQYQSGLSDIWSIAKSYMTTKRLHPVPEVDVPVKPMTAVSLTFSTEDEIFRLGHSTLLIRLDGEYILLDPVFSQRASPVQWAGPKRFHQSPINIEQLPPIKTVIISHDHYDHLDKAAVIALEDKVEHFVTPQKVGDHLIEWGIEPSKVTQLAWWDELTLGELTLVATPAQHFSGRGLFDRDATLWASWVIQGQQSKLFFSGDGGYFSGFKEIGERYGPFDLTMIETGAYNEMWSEIHMLPEQSLQAHIDLNGELFNQKAMLPIHNGTFDLALHDWFEPLERIVALGEKANVNVITPVFGEAISLKAPTVKSRWWREMLANEELVLQSQ